MTQESISSLMKKRNGRIRNGAIAILAILFSIEVAAGFLESAHKISHHAFDQALVFLTMLAFVSFVFFGCEV